MNRKVGTALALAAVAGLAWPQLNGEEWSRFRGPNGTGASEAGTIPLTWTPSDYNWKVQLPGTGHSSPVLFNDRIFLTSTIKEAGKLLVLGLNSSNGGELWRHEISFVPYRTHTYNSFAAASAAVDANGVYVVWSTPRNYTLLALDHDGKKLWEREFGPFESQHGHGASPMVHDGMVILPNDQLGKSFLVAVRADTGETVWRVDRRSGQAAYSTPCVYRYEDGREVLIFNSAAHGISAIDPNSGELVWEMADLFDKRSVSSPVAAGGLVFGSCGSGGGGNYVVAVRPGDPKNGVEPTLAYELRQSAPYVPTSVAKGDLLFLFSDGGVASCLHVPTGEVRWNERLSSGFFGSPVRVRDAIYCISTQGEVMVVRASDEFELLAQNDLGELCHTTPAIAGGKMYIRTHDHLISLGGAEKR